MPNKKRYLVTHSDTNLSVSPVAEILGIGAENIRQGVSLLSTDAHPAEKDVLEFPNLGITSVSLDAKDLARLKEHSGIMAVEEDVEMRVLEEPAASIEEDQRIETNGHHQNDAYQRGYQDAIQQLMESMNQSRNPFDSFNAGNSLFSNSQQNPFFKGQTPPISVAAQPIPWNINMVKAPGAWARGINGAGIRVAVLDTGIANHPDVLPIAGGISLVPGVVSFNDGHSHGTHCAGIIGGRNNGIGIVGVAHACKLYAVKVLADSGSGMSSWIIAGMDWAAAHGMHVASMSLGGLSGPIVAYAQAVKRLQDRGTVVVIAAGNSFQQPNFPWVNAPGNSIIPGVPNASPIAVGAVASNTIIAPFSSRGGQNAIWNQVTVVAPGVNINSSVLGGAYALKSGTSMATPHVAGAAALLKQRFPGISPASVRMRLMSTATDLGAGGYDKTYGSGLINCNSATL